MELEEFFVTLGLMGIWIYFITIISFIITYIINGLLSYKFFKKAGKKPWAGFIPFYGDWVLVEISECHWWYYIISISYSLLNLFVKTDDKGILSVVILLFGVVAMYVLFCINYNIAKKFHQGIGFAVGMTLVPFVFYLILGFSDKYKYDKDIKVNSWGIYDFETKASELRVEKSFCINCGTEISSNFCPKCGKSKMGE